jgi:hypothetical protein
VWRIDVTARARRTIDTLDAGLKDELIERASDFAERPLELLRDSVPGSEPANSYAFDYESSAVAGLRITLFFGDLDHAAKSLTLVAIGQSYAGDQGD